MKVLRNFLKMLRNCFLTFMFFASFFVCGVVYILVRIFVDRQRLLNLEKAFARIILFCAGQKLKVVGKMPDPAQGSYIYMANHLSYLDGFIMIAGLNDSLAPIVASKYYNAPFLHKILVFFGAIEARSLNETVNEAIGTMKQKRSILIFPEGRRSPNGELQQLKRGVWELAEKTNVPIVTCFILNANLAWGCDDCLIRPQTLVLAVGQPLKVTQLNTIYDLNDGHGSKIVALQRLFRDQQIDAYNAQ